MNDNNVSQLAIGDKLTPLELNNIRLDVRHTILTPDYLEQLTARKSETTQKL